MSAFSKRTSVVTRTLVFGFAFAAMTVAASAQTPMSPTAPSAPRHLVPPAQLTPSSAPLSEPVNDSNVRKIAVGVLEELGAERVGLLDEASGALPNAMWDGSDPALVRALLAQLPRRMPSQAMRTITHNLLLPAARQPRAKPDAIDLTDPQSTDVVEDPALGQQLWLLEARAKAVGSMGDWSNVNSLLELVPQDRMTESLTRLRVDGLLVVGNTERACAEGQAALSRQPDTQWQKLLVYCQFVSKQASAAQLGLSLLREQGLDDPVFFWAADVMQGQRAPTPAGLKRLAPLELMMLRTAGRAFPEAIVRDGDPTMMRVLASMPAPPPEEEKLTAAQRKDRIRALQENRVVMSEWAVSLGVLDPEMLRARYLDVDLSQDAKPITLDAATADNVRARVMMFQAAKKQTSPAARAEVIARAIALARADRGQKGPNLVLVGRVYAPMLAELMPAPDLLWFAGSAARGLLAAGMRDKATAWFDLVRQMSRGSLEASEIADSLWAVEHLAMPRSRGNLTPRSLRAWQASIPASAGSLPRQTLLNLLAAVGDPVGAVDWLPVITSPPLPSQPSAPQAALWHGLSLAARDARSGEATAFALALLGETASQGEMPVTLNKAIESLIIVGREDDARLLVAEVALVQGL